MPHQQKWQEGQYALSAQFLAAVSPLVPQAQCRLLADSGLTREQLVERCEQAGWHSLLRIELDKGYYVKDLDAQGRPIWQPLTQVLTQPGQYWHGRVWLWKAHLRQTWLTASWQEGEEAPVVVISDEGAGRQYLCRYRKRMRVEATFQDKKSRGFGLHLTHVRQFDHLDRLLLLLSFAIWWLARLGAACVHHGQRRLFDRGTRRDKSIVRLGRQWLLDILQRAPSAASLARCLPFQRHGNRWRLCLRF